MPIFPFRRKAPLALVPSAVAPGTSIRWDASLVARLQGDHKLFIKRYRQLVVAQNAGNYDALPPILDKFRSALLDHMLTEKTRLYVYLRHQFDGDPSTAKLIEMFSRELDQHGREVMAFIRADAATVRTRAWAEQLRVVGGSLRAHIEREETTLFPLYQPIQR